MLRLFRRNTYTTFLGSVGALYTLAFLTMQLVRTVLWWRYRPYPLPAGASAEGDGTHSRLQ